MQNGICGGISREHVEVTPPQSRSTLSLHYGRRLRQGGVAATAAKPHHSPGPVHRRRVPAGRPSKSSPASGREAVHRLYQEAGLVAAAAGLESAE